MAKILILIEEDKDSKLVFQKRLGNNKNIWINGIRKMIKFAMHARQSEGFIKIIFLENGKAVFEKKISYINKNPFHSIEKLIKDVSAEKGKHFTKLTSVFSKKKTPRKKNKSSKQVSTPHDSNTILNNAKQETETTI